MGKAFLSKNSLLSGLWLSEHGSVAKPTTSPFPVCLWAAQPPTESRFKLNTQLISDLSISCPQFMRISVCVRVLNMELWRTYIHLLYWWIPLCVHVCVCTRFMNELNGLNGSTSWLCWRVRRWSFLSEDVWLPVFSQLVQQGMGNHPWKWGMVGCPAANYTPCIQYSHIVYHSTSFYSSLYQRSMWHSFW